MNGTGFEGAVDRLTSREIIGWVKTGDAPGASLGLELMRRGKVIARWQASDGDQDPLERTPASVARFQIPLPADQPIVLDELGIRVEGTTQLIDISPACAAIEGEVERISDTLLSGWAWRVGMPRERVTLFVFHKRKLIGKVIADRPQEARVSSQVGDGKHGFRLDLAALKGVEIKPQDIRFRYQEGEKLRLLGAAAEDDAAGERAAADVPAGSAPREPAASSLSHAEALREAVEDSLDLGRLKF